ncbi:MAG: NAD(P)/FAD-dependent oxidoreductase, partial [Pseudomonadota bacterium]
KITIHYHTTVTELRGDDWLTGVTFTTPEGDTPIDASALFIMIGAAPNTDWLSGLVETDDKGFALTGKDVDRGSPFETGTDGIFAVGDVRSGSVKRVASSVGEGSVVVSQIWTYVDELKKNQQDPQ